jgi:hypothetical protein
MRWGVLFALLLAACSKGPQADLEYIKQARSAAAEWALVNEKTAQDMVTQSYARSMHEWLRQDIETAAAGLSQPDAPYAIEMQALLRQPDDAAPETLRAHADALKRQEDQLESA